MEPLDVLPELHHVMHTLEQQLLVLLIKVLMQQFHVGPPLPLHLDVLIKHVLMQQSHLLLTQPVTIS